MTVNVQPYQRFGVVSNRGSWTFDVQVKADGVNADLTGFTAVVLSLALPNDIDTQELTASLANSGVEMILPSNGAFTVTFTADQMRTLDQAQYEVGCALTDPDGEDHQLLLGVVTVRHGVVA